MIIEHATYEKVSVSPGACRWNYKCQINAVHEALTNGQEQIAMCVYIDGGCPIIHFVNSNPKAKAGRKLIDNTLGQWATRYNFYFVKYVKTFLAWILFSTLFAQSFAGAYRSGYDYLVTLRLKIL